MAPSKPPSIRMKLLALLGFALVFPFFIRRRPRVEQRVTVFAPPEVVFAFLEDLRNWPAWSARGQSGELRYNYGATSKGLGGTVGWASCCQEGRQEILAVVRDERLDYEVVMGCGQRMRGRLELQRDGACTRVTWRCAWDLASNPYRRYFDLWMKRQIGRDFQVGLANLKAMAESVASEIKVG